MIYEFKCWACDFTEEKVLSVDERNSQVICPRCGTIMERVPSFRGSLKTEHPAWLNKDAVGALQPPDERPIETRTEHDAYCKEHGIIQL